MCRGTLFKYSGETHKFGLNFPKRTCPLCANSGHLAYERGQTLAAFSTMGGKTVSRAVAELNSRTPARLVRGEALLPQRARYSEESQQ